MIGFWVKGPGWLWPCFPEYAGWGVTAGKEKLHDSIDGHVQVKAYCRTKQLTWKNCPIVLSIFDTSTRNLLGRSLLRKLNTRSHVNAAGKAEVIET